MPKRQLCKVLMAQYVGQQCRMLILKETLIITDFTYLVREVDKTNPTDNDRKQS